MTWDFFGCVAFGEEAAAGYLRGDDDGVGLLVDGIFASHLAGLFEIVGLVPAEEFFSEETVLKDAVGGAAIADVFAAALLDFLASSKGCSGECDESVAERNAVAGPAIEEEWRCGRRGRR